MGMHSCNINDWKEEKIHYLAEENVALTRALMQNTCKAPDQEPVTHTPNFQMNISLDLLWDLCMHYSHILVHLISSDT